MTNRSRIVDRLVKLGMLGALSIVLVLLLRFPLFPAVSFLEFEFGDVPIFLAGFAFGPWWGLALTVVVSVIQGLTVSAESSWIGILMHIIASGLPVMAASLIYQRFRTLEGSIVAMGVGVAVKIVVMIICNYTISPLFFTSAELPYAQAQDIVVSLMWWIVAFNAIKAVANGIVTYVVYKPLSKVFFKKNLFSKKENDMEVIETRPSKKGLILSIIGMALSLFGFIWVIIALCYGFFMSALGAGVDMGTYGEPAFGVVKGVIVLVYGLIGGGCGLAGLILGSLGKKTCQKVFPKLGIGFGIADLVLFVVATLVAFI